MISRRLLRSLLAVVALAGFFAASVSEARAVQPCPHHDGAPAANGTDTPARAQDPALENHGHHGPHDATNAGDAAHGPCSCIGCFETGAQLQVVTPTAIVVAFFAPPTAFIAPVRDQLPPAPPAVRWRPDLPNAPPLLA